MHYIYMNNFRGFNKTLLPVSTVTFLIGENSTGKSSFLKILKHLYQPDFWMRGDFDLHEESGFGGFNDVVSAWSTDKTFFQVGVMKIVKDSKGKITQNFSSLVFRDEDGLPKLSRYFNKGKDQEISFNFSQEGMTYGINEVESSFATEQEAINNFLLALDNELLTSKNTMKFPKGFPSRLPLPIAITVAKSLNKNKTGLDFENEMVFASDITWIAPIRSKPLRTYDGLKRRFSPEGDHAPHVLRKSLENGNETSEFPKKLEKFGESSGLFETVIAHSFGNEPQSPFELLIKFNDVNININNVGYGVSQVLPLIVDFISADKGKHFAVQQPEVHLHPRAQAALGDLVFSLAKEKKHSFLIETHSDYLIDRFRLACRKDKSAAKVDAQVIFFSRVPTGNNAVAIKIGSDGTYPKSTPKDFRDFFIKEEIKLLDI